MTADTYPLVTIAIPTYNRADGFLKEAIRCALNQTYSNIEIIISDNCSVDNTTTVVKGFNDPKIRYFKHKENIGANNNFNFCVEQARGAYFLLLHDDDLIDNDFIDICMKAAEYNTDIGLIRTGTRIIDSEGHTKLEAPNMVNGVSTGDFFLGWFSGKTRLYLCSTLFNTQRLKEIGGFQSRKNLYQDVVAEVQLAAKYGRVDIQDVKASFRRHHYNMGSSTRVDEWCEDCLYLLDIMCNLAPEKSTLIRQKGMFYFCRQNYNRIYKYMPFKERLPAYLLVYKKFQHNYSPVHYFYLRNVNHFKNIVKRKIKKVVLK
jgi:glycosyltransferase involved in cell wall biosynthesis